MKYYIIINKDTLELAVVDSKYKPENSVLVTDDNIDFIIPKANNIVFTEVVEGATLQEIEDIKNKQLEELSLLYSEKISNIIGIRESIERKAIDGTEIPKQIIDERERLKQEYNTLKQQIK